MKNTCLPLTVLLLATAPAPAQQPANDLLLTSARRTYSDGSQWDLGTSKGSGSLRRVYSDNSQWELTLPGHRYSIRRTYSNDFFNWSLSESGGSSLTIRSTYSQDPSNWSVGSGRLRTTYSNSFTNWDGGSLSLRCSYSDCSGWDIRDAEPHADPAVKAGMVFVAVLEGSILKR